MNNLDVLINEIQVKTMNFNELEKARYVYILLGNMLNFDSNFYFANEKNRTKIYKKLINNDKCLNKCLEEKNVICLSLAYLYKYILKFLNISSDLIEDDYRINYKHVYNKIYLSDGRIVNADLQLDLTNIKFNYKTQYFTVNLLNFSQELENIDRKIGYINDMKYYANEYNYLLHTIVDNLPLDEKITFLLENLEPYDYKDVGYVDFKWHILGKIKEFFSYKERDQILVNDLYYEQNNQRIYTICIIGLFPEPLIYLYSFERKQFEHISFYDYSQMMKNNLKPVNDLRKLKI